MAEAGLDAILICDEKNQRYACGFPFTDGAVLVSRQKAWLITDSRYIEAASAAAGGCAEVLLYDREHALKDLLRSILRENGLERVGAEEETLSFRAYQSYAKVLERELLPAQDIFRKLRASKTEEELASMRQAQAISEAALEEVLQLIRPGMTEREVAAELVYRMLRHGGEGNSFDPIAVTGKKTSMPHGVPGDEVIREGDFVTMDFGCLKDGYCSDMTRTVTIGHASDEMKNIYAIVLKAQLAGIAAARAGIPCRDIDTAARNVITEAGYGPYFGHGFGHSLGLDIHESPRASQSEEGILPLNTVVSAEPGIYLPGKFGVRIEDVMILREDHAEVITRAPKAELLILNN